MKTDDAGSPYQWTLPALERMIFGLSGGCQVEREDDGAANGLAPFPAWRDQSARVNEHFSEGVAAHPSHFDVRKTDQICSWC